MDSNVVALSVKSAASKLNVSERFIAKLVASGQLPSVKLGRRRLIREASLKAFLDRREVAVS